MFQSFSESIEIKPDPEQLINTDNLNIDNLNINNLTVKVCKIICIWS